jgi:hypothetical protein
VRANEGKPTARDSAKTRHLYQNRIARKVRKTLENKAFSPNCAGCHL